MIDKKLESQAANLAALSDDFGKAIAAIEAGLKRLNLGVEAWVEVQAQTIYLGYARKPSWGLYVKEYKHSDVTSGGRRETNRAILHRLDQVPRLLRVASIHKLPMLVDQLRTNADELANGLAEATKTAWEFVAAMDAALKEKEDQPK